MEEAMKFIPATAILWAVMLLGAAACDETSTAEDAGQDLPGDEARDPWQEDPGDDGDVSIDDLPAEELLLFDDFPRSYGGAGLDVFRSILQTSEGGYIAVGKTDSFGAGETDIWVVKLNATGGIEWEKSIGGSNIDSAESVVQADDGGFVLTGTTSLPDWSDGDFWVIKLSSSGEVEWKNLYTGDDNDHPAVILQDPWADGYLLAGGGAEAWVAKLDPDGVMEWGATYGGDSGFEINAMNITPDGGLILAGSTAAFNTEDWRPESILLKTSGSGSLEWAGRYAYHGFEDVMPTSDGGFVAVGTVLNLICNCSQLFVAKVDSSGDYVWQRALGGDEGSQPYSVVQTPDSGFLVAGQTQAFGQGVEMWLIKLSSDGWPEWQNTYGGESSDVAYTVLRTSDGGIILSGQTSSFGEGGDDGWILKLDSAGSISGLCPALIHASVADEVAPDNWVFVARPVSGTMSPAPADWDVQVSDTSCGIHEQCMAL